MFLASTLCKHDLCKGDLFVLMGKGATSEEVKYLFRDADVIMNGSLLNRANQVKYKIAKDVGIMHNARRFSNKACLSNLFHITSIPTLFIVLRFGELL